MNQLQGKCAVVTGAATSLGQAIATKFAREGARVALVDKTDLGVTAKAVGESLKIAADVGKPGEARRAVDEAAKAFGRLDILVNAAHTNNPWKRLDEKDEADFVRILDGDVMGAVRAMKAAYPHFRAAGAGRVINVGSAYGSTSYYNLTDGVTRDWALQGLTRAAAVEWAQHNILVNYLSAGAIDVKEFHDYRAQDPAYVDHLVHNLSLARVGDPIEDFGGAAVFLASDEACFIIGHPVYADGGQHMNTPVFEPGNKLEL